ncbi:MAG: TetR/AcrR family transcriptional regulator [Novosphingobium sp.]|nr:TetR/AcrR family transcriptional regulator [Novosphingobium sp.]
MKASARRGRPTPEETQEKIARTLAVAREMFSDLGYRAVTMREVAARADVSTRTLYNHFPDKLKLFVECLDFGSQEWPQPAPAEGEDAGAVLCRFGIALVQTLSTDSHLRLGILVFREGAEFPELMEAGNAHRERYVLRPVVAYLRSIGLEDDDGEDNATLLLAMIVSEWQRRVSYRQPMPSDEETERHVARAVSIFLDGARAYQAGKA